MADVSLHGRPCARHSCKRHSKHAGQDGEHVGACIPERISRGVCNQTAWLHSTARHARAAQYILSIQVKNWCNVWKDLSKCNCILLLHYILQSNLVPRPLPLGVLLVGTGATFQVIVVTA